MRPDRIGPHYNVDSEMAINVVSGGDVASSVGAAYPNLKGITRVYALPDIKENWQHQNFLLSGATLPGGNNKYQTLVLGVLLDGRPLQDIEDIKYMYQFYFSVNTISDVAIPAGLWVPIIGKMDANPVSNIIDLTRYNVLGSTARIRDGQVYTLDGHLNGLLGDLAKSTGEVDVYPIFFGVMFLHWNAAAYGLTGNVSVGAHIWTGDMKGMYNPQSN